MACFLPFPGTNTVLRAVCAGAKQKFHQSLEISTVTSHTAGKNQKNPANILIQFSVMLFGFRVQ